MTQNPACLNCPSTRLCFRAGLDADDQSYFSETVRPRIIYRRGGSLFDSEDPVKSIYFVCSGSVKTSVAGIGGDEHILRFYLPGDVIGLDSINRSAHNCSATALETSSICALPIDHINHSTDLRPTLMLQLIDAMSREIACGDHLAKIKGRAPAISRLAYFLITLAQKFSKHGYSDCNLRLTMGRREIADHLGLTIETVSRTLTRFQKEGTLRVDGKQILIWDKKRLMECCSPDFQYFSSRPQLRPVTH